MTLSKTAVDEAASFAEYQAIAAAIQPYIDGARTGDGEGMRKAFFDHARIVGTLDGKPINMTADEFCAFISQVGGSPEVKSYIRSIDFEGNAASARVEFENWGGVRYTDFFVLFKENGTWKISGKVYSSHSRS
jgi:hypothetical protein